MSRRRLLAAPLIVVFLLAPVTARSQQQYHNFQPPAPSSSLSEPGMQGKFDIPFSTQYIWRGVELNHQSVFQPSARLNDQGVEVEAIGNMDLTGSNDQRGKFTRWIYRAGLARRSREGEVALSYIYYDNREIGYPKTQEVALQLCWGYPFFVGADAYWDFDNGNGFYFNSSMGMFIDIDPLRIIPRIGVGYATKNYQNFYFGVKEDSFLDVTASLAVELNVVGPLYLTVRGDYYELCKSGLRHSDERVRQGENFWGEGAVSVRF